MFCVCICETSNVRRTKETRNLCVRTFFGLFIFPLSSVQVSFFFFSCSAMAFTLATLYIHVYTFSALFYFLLLHFFQWKICQEFVFMMFCASVLCIVYGANFLTNSWSPFERKRCTNLYHAIIVCWRMVFVHLTSTHAHKTSSFCTPMVFFHRHVSYTYFCSLIHSIGYSRAFD